MNTPRRWNLQIRSTHVNTHTHCLPSSLEKTGDEKTKVSSMYRTCIAKRKREREKAKKKNKARMKNLTSTM